MKNPAQKKIKFWAEQDRPREKLRHKGKTTLSDAELIAILLGSGAYGISAVDLSRAILASVDNNLHELALLTCEDLMKFNGIGEAKAVSIVAALELGRRRKDSEIINKSALSTSGEVYAFFKQYLLDLKHEEFWILLMKRNNQILKPVKISSGGISGTLVDAKIIFKHAIENLAAAVILVHNHPSGSKSPSPQDIKLTAELVAAGKIMEVPVKDHLIFTDNGYFSFSDASMLH